MTRSTINRSMHTVIKPTSGLASFRARELWAHRELLAFFVWRDVLVRYKQTVIGVAWALIRPLLLMVVFTIVFGRIAGLPSEGVPYPLLTFAALLPWQYFASAFGESSASVVGSASLISRVYFPRLIIPISAVVSPMLDLAVALAVLAAMLIFYGIAPGAPIVFLPLFLLLAVLTALGLGTWFAALYVRYRDIRHLLPFVIQVGIFISPVGFSSAIVPERWRFLYSLNPLVGVIDGFRWSLLGGNSTLYMPGVIVSAVIATGLLVSGVTYFNHVERTFADII